MCTQKKWWRKLFILPLCFLLFTACNQNEPKKTDEPVTTKDDVEKNPEPDNVTFKGTLDRLYVDTSAFNKLEDGKRVMFCHSYRPAENLLTLAGWITKGNKGAPDSLPPDISLLRWRTDTISIEQNLYLGNVFLDKNDIKKIKDAYEKRPKYKYVVFVPEIADQHIKYKIYVSNDPPSTNVPSPSPLNDTGLYANPSPPREN
jgi:hypothetical protein